MTDNGDKNNPLIELMKRARDTDVTTIKPFFKLFNKNAYVILFLYLLHHPDYGYNIAKNFTDATKKGMWNAGKSSTESLHRGSYVNKCLGEMKRSALLNCSKEKNSGRERVYYTVNPQVLSCEFQVERGEDFVVDEYELSHIVEWCIQDLQVLSPTEIECIEKINALRKYDYLTVLGYFRILISEMQAIYSQGGVENKHSFLKGKKLGVIAEKMDVEDFTFFARDYIMFLDSVIISSIYEERGLIDEVFRSLPDENTN